MKEAISESTRLVRKEIERAFDALDDWIGSNGWAGYDPYDVRGQDWYVALFGGDNWFFRKSRSALAVLESRVSPLLLRRLLRVEKRINPKGMGLLASGWLARWTQTGNIAYRLRAEEALSWLDDSRCKDHAGASWGYPFHWQSRVFLPRGTPSVVVSGTVGSAFMDHFELTQSEQSFEMAAEIAEFFVHALNRSFDESDRLCFSYTPIDNFRVHNASLFAAAHLARFGSLAQRDDYVELALRAARYTISEQNSDGSFYYWGSEPPSTIDHYHTGFVLRHLDTICQITSADFIAESLKGGYAFYVDQLFTSDGLPKYTPTDLYPIDVHSCAEALLCLCQLGGRFGGREMLGSVFQLTQRRMLRDEGWYIAAIRRRKGRDVPIEIPYLRWGEAWMLLALARLLESLDHHQDATNREVT